MHAAVLGSPVAHSLSPILHAAAYAALGLDDWSYHAISCDEVFLPVLVPKLAASGRWAGVSLTMPLKTAAVALCSSVTTDLGAVNTLVFDDGLVAGHNTDVDGILAGFAELGVPLPTVAMLGAGGTARAAVAAMAQLGVGTLSIHVRTPARAVSVAELARSFGLRVSISGLGDVPSGVPVVSTLPASGAELVTVHGPLLDVVYAPWPTPLATGAARAGYPVVGGLVVLVGQAVRQVELMTGALTDPAAAAAVAAVMRTAGERALGGRN